MNFDSFIYIIAPLVVFTIGVLLIPYAVKPRNKVINKSFKLINELEKKYIY